jgi:DNA invertase Pin-like site-specific DNA recombinase
MDPHNIVKRSRAASVLLDPRDARLKVLTGVRASIGMTRPEGRFILIVFASLAEFERELKRQGMEAGMAAAKRRGRCRDGRPRQDAPAGATRQVVAASQGARVPGGQAIVRER